MPSIHRSFTLALFCGLTICSWTCCLPAGAQTWIPQTIAFTGQGDIKNSDLVAVTGLTPGKQVTSAEIEVAMQHLVDTGLFSDMRYTVNNTALTFALTTVAPDQLFPAKYSNFVWWKDEELTALVHARIPLFTGKVPVTGTMKGAIEDALAATVLEKGVKASVTSIASAGLGGGPVSGVVFSIAEPAVAVGQIRVGEVGAGAAAKVDEIRKRYEGQEYNAYSTGPAIQANLQDAYLDLGYLDIVSDVPVRGEPQVAPSKILVDLTTAVHEGAVYHVSGMAWPESAVVSKQACAEASPLKPGSVASRFELLSSKASVERRFAAMGYLDAKLAVMSKKDETAHQIAYRFDVVPGDPYTVAAVKTTGLDADRQAQFDKAWKLAPGQVYNGDTVAGFLRTSGFMRTMSGYAPRVELATDRKSKTVVVMVGFVKGGAR